jgi:hypothetical protein
LGREQVEERVVENLLRETDFSTEKISALVNVATEFVEEIKKNVLSKV